MPNLVVNRRAVLSGYVFSSQALAYFSYLTVQPSQYQKIIYDQYLFRPLVSSGIFAELDRLIIPAAELEQHGTISLKTPISTPVILVNTPTWTQYQGWDFNGTTQYVNMIWTPAIGPNYQQNSACVFVYLRENTQSTGVDIGSNTTAGAHQVSIFARYTDDKFYEACNDSNATDFITSTDSRGLFSVQRTASNNVNLIKNGVTGGSTSDASTGTNPAYIYLGAKNNNGAAVSFSNRQIAIAGTGSSNINQGTLSTILNNYMTVLGTNVY